MKYSVIAGGLLAASLTGCIAVSGVHDEVDAVAINTEVAVRVCGGEANVKEVTDDGYKCRTETD